MSTSRGYATVCGWLDIAEDAYCDGERKTCEDMTREAYKTFKLFATEIPLALRRDCIMRLYAMKNLLNEGIVVPPAIH